jgi:hypothetical protein
MKTKLITLVIALFGLSINAALAEAPAVNGNVGAGYSSDYFRRGEALSQEAMQAQVGFNVGLGAVDLFGDYFTNHSTESTGLDSDETTFGLSTSLFEDSLSAYVGVYNTDTDAQESDLEAFASVRVNTLLTPTLSIYRDTDDSLYTFEGQVSYDVDLDFVSLELAGIYGNTENSSVTDTNYSAAKVTAVKTFKENLNVYADVSLSDTDSRENETTWGIGLNVKF